MAKELELNKERADAEKYYTLLMSKAGKLRKGSTVCLIHIGNLDVIRRILDSSSESNYIIIDKTAYEQIIPLLYPFLKDSFIATAEDDSIITELEKLTMKFDKIIMNPPYSKNLHLKILAEAITHLSDKGKCVNLAPSPRISSIRNNWSVLAQKKFRDIEAYQYIESFEKIDNPIKIFNAGIQQHLGITVYSKKLNPIEPDHFAEKPVPASLMKKIMTKIEANSIKANPGTGKYKLPLSGIHGHIDSADFLNIMSLTYEEQLKSKGATIIKFKTEEDRHDFYDFWMSPLGKFVVSLWKVDTNVESKWIPYFWAKTNEDFYKYFEITEDEQKLIEKSMEKYK